MKSSHLPYKLLILLIIPLLVGCAKGLSGKIYLDENANLKQDTGEPLLADLSFTVTLDEQEIAHGITNDKGQYEVKIKNKGNYCVQVTNSDINSSNATRVVAKNQNLFKEGIKFIKTWAQSVLKMLQSSTVLAQASTETSCTNGIDDDFDGFTDCNDTDCVSHSDCVEDCDDNIDNDGDGDVDCNDSDCSSDSACSTSSDDDDDDDTPSTTVEAGKACQEVSGLQAKIDVPVALDFESTIEGLSDETLNTTLGQTITNFIITVPASCTLSPLTLPTFLEPSNASIKANAYTASTGKLYLEDAISYVTCTEEEAIIITEDSLVTCPVNLLVQDNQIVGDQTTSLTIKADCPGNQNITLQKYTINLDGSDDIDVENSITNDQGIWAPGDTVQIQTSITNNSAATFASTDINLTVSTASEVTDRSFTPSTGTCSGTQTATCKFALAPNETVTVSTSFTIPASLTSNTSYAFSTTLNVTSGGSIVAFNGNTLTISVTAD